MPRGIRVKPSDDLVPDEVTQQIRSFRPVRLYMAKQRKKGTYKNPLNFRVEYSQLSTYKQTRFLQKAVDKYLQLLDEHDIDEHAQIEGKLFAYLLTKSEQKKYFDSIHAPTKPSRKLTTDNGNDSEDQDSIDITTLLRERKRRKNAKAAYLVQVKNFAVNLPERLKVDYLLYVGLSSSKSKSNGTGSSNGHNDENVAEPVRQRRKSLTNLPDSLQTNTSTGSISDQEMDQKPCKEQLHQLHQCVPSVLYFDEKIPEGKRPIFNTITAKRSYMRATFNRLKEAERLHYISQSIEKWNEFLQSNPDIVENQIPTLHLLLGKIDHMILYFTSIGLPIRPATNRLVFYNQEREQIGSQQLWTDLSQDERDQYGERLAQLKSEYNEKFLRFVEDILPNDYVTNEFFRNVKYAMKDYEVAIKDMTLERNQQRREGPADVFRHRMAMKNDWNQFQQIKQKLLLTSLTNEQKNLLEQMSEFVETLIKTR